MKAEWRIEKFDSWEAFRLFRYSREMVANFEQRVWQIGFWQFIREKPIWDGKVIGIESLRNIRKRGQP